MAQRCAETRAEALHDGGIGDNKSNVITSSLAAMLFSQLVCSEPNEDDPASFGLCCSLADVDIASSSDDDTGKVKRLGGGDARRVSSPRAPLALREKNVMEELLRAGEQLAVRRHTAKRGRMCMLWLEHQTWSSAPGAPTSSTLLLMCASAARRVSTPVALDLRLVTRVVRGKGAAKPLVLPGGRSPPPSAARKAGGGGAAISSAAAADDGGVGKDDGAARAPLPPSLPHELPPPPPAPHEPLHTSVIEGPSGEAYDTSFVEGTPSHLCFSIVALSPPDSDDDDDEYDESIGDGGTLLAAEGGATTAAASGGSEHCRLGGLGRPGREIVLHFEVMSLFEREAMVDAVTRIIASLEHHRATPPRSTPTRPVSASAKATMMNE